MKTLIPSPLPVPTPLPVPPASRCSRISSFSKGALTCSVPCARPCLYRCSARTSFSPPTSFSRRGAAGADAALLIAAILSDQEIRYLRKIADQLGLDCLVEVHNDEETERALALGVDLMGINNRDLTTFTTDLSVTQRLATTYRQALCQGGVLLVSESGLKTHEDLQRVGAAGVGAVLVGEALMRQPDVAAALRALRGMAPQYSPLPQQQ